MVKKNTFSDIENLRSLSISPGAVFLGPFANIDHDKFLIVVGVSKDKIMVCSAIINSNINQYIRKRPHLLSLQIELKEVDYDFLSHDSYVNCAQPLKASFNHFMNESQQYCGMLNSTDLSSVQQNIINSGVLTADEINLFFGKTIQDSE